MFNACNEKLHKGLTCYDTIMPRGWGNALLHCQCGVSMCVWQFVIANFPLRPQQ